MAKKRTPLFVIISLIIIAFLVLVTNLGISVFYPSPDYNAYCNSSTINPIDHNPTPAEMEEQQAAYETCNSAYNEAQSTYNQVIFYILAGTGFVLLLLGLFINYSIVEYTMISSGGILVIEAMVRNFQNKAPVFIASVVILIIFIIFAFKKLMK